MMRGGGGVGEEQQQQWGEQPSCRETRLCTSTMREFCVEIATKKHT